MLFSDRPPEELGHFPGFLMNWLGQRSGERLAARLADLGLHPRHFGIMHVLDKRPGMTQQELSDHVEIDRSTLVALLDELEARGVAERRPHEEDRRKHSLHLTPEGRQVLGKMRRRAAQHARQTFGVLSAEEQAELLRLLRKLAGLDPTPPDAGEQAGPARAPRRAGRR